MNLPETGAENYNWNEEGVYQLEVTDPVQGGADGIANRQATELAKRTRNLHNRESKVESKLEGVGDNETVLSILRGGIAAELNTLEKLRASLTLMINSMVGGGVTADEVYAVIRGGVDAAHDTLKELYDYVNALAVNYEKVDATLKQKQVVNNVVDLSAAGIGTITLSADTAFSFTGFQVNKNYLLIVNTNGHTPSFTAPAKHLGVAGMSAFTNTGIYYVSLTCIDDTAGAEKLLTVIMKGV